jgi:SAM-dependent methyltransferase
MRSARRPWGDYIDAFHTEHPGITEDVLARCTDDTGASPYDWIADGLDPQARVVDLASGSGPTRAGVAGDWIGVDRSTSELARARQRGRGPLVRGDVTSVPLRCQSTDAVLCSMALMLIEPCGSVLDEIRRIMTPAGELRLLLPTTTPLTVSDRVNYLRLFVATRSRPRFPATPLRRHAARVLAGSGLVIVADDAKRFGYPITTPADLELFVGSWYRPDRSPGELAFRHRRRIRTTGIGVPLRRIIARSGLGGG